ncbi:hypothetical protein [Psychroserpens algicola]|uniref:Uncharacterized protein n=1 Tax=Psychroserpens algicola TaxID=1719034 RepID=A0ABT0H5F8_9FLAO|nr:hypothetical protein [Psychroserpens algicola]MCK8479032.1 hypothetical protein [Psychroserpens algicola]
MEITKEDLILSFWQKGANNCASIALIKASIEVFGLNNVFDLSHNGDEYKAILKNDNEVFFNQQNLNKSIIIGSFQKSKDLTESKLELYKKIKDYAEICFVIMVANCAKIENIDFDKALKKLSNGANARFVSKYLGLEKHASKAFRRKDHLEGMIAWIHSPWRKHVVYMSQGVFDFYGVISKKTRKFPKRIQFKTL